MVLIIAAASVTAQLQIARSTIDGGGGLRTTSNGGQFQLSGTIGQPDAGVMAGGSFELTGGYWFGIVPTDCDESGNVSLFDQSSFADCLSGPGNGVLTGCQCFDAYPSGTVDLRDFSLLQVEYSGP